MTRERKPIAITTKPMREHVTEIHAQREPRKASGLNFAEIIGREQLDLMHAVNDERALLGKGPIPLQEIRTIDESCSGHVDYADKLALRLQRLVES